MAVGWVGGKCSSLRSAMARSNLISREMLDRSSVNLMYLTVWKSHGHVRVGGLLFEVLDTSGQSLCPGRINLSRVRAECSKLHDEVANWGQKQKKGWEREWGLNLTHAIALTQGFM